MKATFLAALLLTSGCVGFPHVVPTTNDARAWAQPWVAQEQRDYTSYLKRMHEQECDPLDWPNTAGLASQHPECADIIASDPARYAGLR